MPTEVEAAVVELRRSRPYWAAAVGVRVGQAQGGTPLPLESAVYRAELIDRRLRDRRSRKGGKSLLDNDYEEPRAKTSTGDKHELSPSVVEEDSNWVTRRKA